MKSEAMELEYLGETEDMLCLRRLKKEDIYGVEEVVDSGEKDFVVLE
jgi:hypothetical protein